MYINYNYLYSKGLNESDLDVLQKIFQNEFLLLEPHLNRFEGFLEMGLITYLKGKENTVEGVRISKKGKSFMDKVGIMDYREDVDLMVNRCCAEFDAMGKHIGVSKKEVLTRMLWFMSQTGFSVNVVENTIQEYLINNPEYTMSLENLIWKPQSRAFSVKYNLKDSRLYDIICTKHNLNSDTFLEPKKGVMVSWLAGLSRLIPPKRGSEDVYLTGSYKTDIDLIGKFKKLYFDRIKK